MIASALPEDYGYLRGLGVGELIDRNADVAAEVREAHPDGVDALLDVVSQTPDDSLLAKGGRLASPLGAAGEGAGRFNVMAEPTPANLERLADLLETGALRFRSSGAIDSSRPARRSRRCLPPTPRASSA